MKFLYSWLLEYLDVDLPPEKIAEILESMGVEVEEMVDLAAPYRDTVVVGEIVELQPHPKADRLQVLKIHIGTETIQQVSSAPDLYVGKKVVVALPGTRLEKGVVEARPFRGVESYGMLLSEEELGLEEHSTSVIELPKEAKPGEPPFRYLGLEDTLFEIYTATNRADLLGVVGVAREIAAKLGKRVHPPKPQVQETDRTYRIMLDDAQGCPRYTARVIEGVRVGPSPAWLRRRLMLCGFRSINNVVDVTNYVLLELGHPLHAFDLAKLKDLIVVRRARDGESILTLDGEERTLDPEILVIADAERPVAIAGIIGGEETGVTEETTDILLESAYFDPETIRRGVSKLGINTESSRRFARGVDPEIPPISSARAAQLILELAGGQSGPLVDAYPHPIPRTTLMTTGERIGAILGIPVSNESLITTLRRLEFQAEEREGRVQIVVPSFRQDVRLEEDLAEEYAKVLGYDEIPGTLQASGAFQGTAKMPYEDLLSWLTRAGFTEVKTLEFVSESMVTPFTGLEHAVKIRNPLGAEYAYMRVSLLPGLLQVVSLNLRRGVSPVLIFELGKTFHWQGPDVLPKEAVRLGAAVAGRLEDHWAEAGRAVDVYDLKKVLTALEEAYGVRFRLMPAEFRFLQQGAEILLDGQPIGWLGEVHRDLLRLAGIKTPVYALELDPTRFEPAAPAFEIPRFPPVKRDLSLLVDADRTYQEIAELIESAHLKSLDAFWLIDLFEGDPLPKGKKSLTLRFRFLNPEGTLEQAEVQKELERLAALLTEKGIVIRGLDRGT